LEIEWRLGANSTIDRADLGPATIDDGVTIGNLLIGNGWVVERIWITLVSGFGTTKLQIRLGRKH